MVSDARLIVRAVNAHADLVAALTRAAVSLEEGADWFSSHELSLNAQRARAALAKVQSANSQIAPTVLP